MTENLNSIGLDVEKSQSLVHKLNDLLANYSVFYINTRGYHWNIRGDKFFELHVKFEELYTDLFAKIDDVAERIQTLGGTPVHSYSDYADMAEIKERKDVSDGYQAVAEIIDAFRILLSKQRTILNESDELNDEGTNALMSDYIREQEKLVWMYTAFLNR